MQMGAGHATATPARASSIGLTTSNARNFRMRYIRAYITREVVETQSPIGVSWPIRFITTVRSVRSRQCDQPKQSGGMNTDA